ncbi:hypothetical protein J5S49_09100 [Virgibacillus halodenitrificans]|uniref:TIGR04104 family putative zinc finger protein n=1 Tax=Virgibacillus halodenitrificans TaxID=1482 RepID=UPI00045C43BB|nr:hypothetical protein [Virgibacillus halodenitrificans]CDQ32513.1 cxxc_20_cxxc protein [Virgibacillus halodenitrificans]
MPTCENCKYKWTYVQTIRVQFRFRGGIRCPNCHKRQYLTTKSQVTNVAISLVMIYILSFINDKQTITLISGILYIIALTLIMQLVTPLVTTLTSRKSTL